MSHDHSALIAQLRESLTEQRYNAMVVHDYCQNAEAFFTIPGPAEGSLEAATPAEVSSYLHLAVRSFRQTPRLSMRASMGFHSEVRNSCVVAARAEAMAT